MMRHRIKIQTMPMPLLPSIPSLLIQSRTPYHRVNEIILVLRSLIEAKDVKGLLLFRLLHAPTVLPRIKRLETEPPTTSRHRLEPILILQGFEIEAVEIAIGFILGFEILEVGDRVRVPLLRVLSLDVLIGHVPLYLIQPRVGCDLPE